MLGIQTREELEDATVDVEVVAPPQDLDALTDRLEQAESRDEFVPGPPSAKEQFIGALRACQAPEEVDAVVVLEAKAGTLDPKWVGVKAAARRAEFEPPADPPQDTTPDSQPEEPLDDFLAAVHDALAKVNAITDCQRIGQQAVAEMPGEAEAVESMVAARIKQIRGSRGPKSNKPTDKPDGETRES
jgi:hypothetical protein